MLVAKNRKYSKNSDRKQTETLKDLRKVKNYPKDPKNFRKNYKYIFNIILKINTSVYQI